MVPKCCTPVVLTVIVTMSFIILAENIRVEWQVPTFPDFFLIFDILDTSHKKMSRCAHGQDKQYERPFADGVKWGDNLVFSTDVWLVITVFFSQVLLSRQLSSLFISSTSQLM